MCDEDLCKADYFTLRATHDNCDHEDLSQEAEEGLHDLEESCEALNCNSGSADSDPTVCDDHDHDSHDDSGAKIGLFATAVMGAGAAFLAL